MINFRFKCNMMVNNKQACFGYYIMVSTEDHVQLVKGGIGTYLGLLLKSFEKHLPNIKLIWITESPTTQFFVSKMHNHRIFYVPKNQYGVKNKIERACARIHKLLSTNQENKIAIEAPDWEGLLSNLFSYNLGKNTLKITRLHSVLELTKQLENNFSVAEIEQIKREHQQILNSDIISAPTSYVYNFTKMLFDKHFSGIPKCIIPNFINMDFRNTKLISRKDACSNFNKIIGNGIIFPNHKNIFCVGSLEHRKGIDLILKMAENLVRADRNINFYLIGHYEKNGDSLTLNTKYTREYLESIIPTDIFQNIYICGYIPYSKLQGLYNACDMFLFCYRHDNFPGALIEACLSGKNIVYLKRGGCKEIMNYKSKNLGIGFDGDDEETIIINGQKAISKSLQNPGRYTATAVRKKYDSTKLVMRMCNAYKF